jgi:hypothetical protein
LRRSNSSDELVENFGEEGAGSDERKSTDGSESGLSHPPDFLPQRGGEVRYNLLSSPLFESDMCFRLSQLAQQRPQQQQQSHSPVTPTRQSQTVVSTLSASGIMPEPAGPMSPFKTSTTFDSPRLDVASHSPVEKLEAVKQYLRDRADQPLHHVEYVGLVSLLKDSVQGP